jgi:hypothetical protein
MLQRIQTIFLLGIIIAMVTLCFVPIWTKVDLNTGHSYTMYAWHFKETIPLAQQVYLVKKPYMIIGILAILVILLTCYALFRYDNRLKQLQLCALNSILMTGSMGCILYWTVKNDAKFLVEAKSHYHLGFVAIIVAILSNLLANQFIKRDERLIRESAKIR